MTSSIPQKALVALPESPEEFTKGHYKIVGPEEAKISAFDRSFHFGDSIYEVARTYNGIIFDLEGHLKRMENSARLALFSKTPPQELIVRMIHDTAQAWFRKYGNRDIYIRWVLSRGVSDLNIKTSLASDPYVLVFVKEVTSPTATDFEKGLHYAVVKRLRNYPQALDPNMKSGNYLNNILALAEAQALGADDAILPTHDGYITEGSTNNVYMISKGEILTAPVSLGILSGITRQWLFKAAAHLSIPTHECLIPIAQFENADELFMTSSIKELLPITKLNGRPIKEGRPGPLTRKLMDEFKNVLTQYLKQHKGDSLYV